ncbi:cuticle protein AM1199-like [Portunus trituberculatus]|uniref:cuticle protein AM1199-like n=1 Tax=Portunus trituberculatus TaxID=210409 RepID=UPI001E1CD4B4|nr:cuticle protein AM1199-like [Portunus trituberculatus]
MKLIIFACLAALAVAAPQFQEEFRPDYRPIAILRDEREDYGDGNFRYEFETENGILTNAVGTPGSQGQSNIQGFFRFPLDDGSIAEVQYVADELGYQPVSNLIPTPHPLPAHAIEQIRFAEELRAQGATWDQYGFRLTR